MSRIYVRQRTYFRKAYETGKHGWPVEGPTPRVAALLQTLGDGKGRRALDLGCGEGRHTILLATRGYAVTALDLEPLALCQARARVRQAGLHATFSVGDALDLKFSDAAFDLVLDYGCFHHVVTRDWPRYRREVARVLNPGGHLLLSVFSTKFKHHPGERRTRNWIVHRNHYDHFFTQAEIRRALSERFDFRALSEEHEGLNGFHHCLLRLQELRRATGVSKREQPGANLAIDRPKAGAMGLDFAQCSE
jgi:SAM-dependent methyltransferase